MKLKCDHCFTQMPSLMLTVTAQWLLLAQFHRRGNIQELFTAGKKQGQDLNTSWSELKARVLGLVACHILIIKEILYHSVSCHFCWVFSTPWCVCKPQITLKCSGFLLLCYSWGQNVKVHPFNCCTWSVTWCYQQQSQLISYQKLTNLMQMGHLDGHIIFLVCVLNPAKSWTNKGSIGNRAVPSLR